MKVILLRNDRFSQNGQELCLEEVDKLDFSLVWRWHLFLTIVRNNKDGKIFSISVGRNILSRKL